MRLTPIATPQIKGPRNGGGVSFRNVLGTGPQGLPGPGSAAWTASTAVTTGAVRQAPDGSWIKSVANRTTRSSFDATEETFWEAVLAGDTIEATALSAAIEVQAEATAARALGWAIITDAAYAGGADPTGVADCTAAFTAAAALARTIYFPTGTYKFDGPGLNLSTPQIEGAGPSRTTINIASGQYFLDGANAWTRLIVNGIKFSGGAGALRSTFSGVNVNGFKRVTNCWFTNYTAAAVTSNASDEPYWVFDSCQFDANTGGETNTMGVALAGSADSVVFRSCSFLRNRIGVKLRRPATCRFESCDFIPFGSGDGSNGRAKVWLVPGATAFGSVFFGCKFGNENMTSLDKHVVIADEAAGTYVGDRLPVLTSDSTATAYGLTFTACSISGNSPPANPPLIYSTTPDLRGLHVGPLTLIGTAPDYIVEFRTAPAAGRLTQDSVVGPLIGSGLGTEGFVPRPSNANGWAKVIDPQGFATHDSIPHNTGAGDVTGYLTLLATAINSFTQASGATKASGTDALGGSDAAEITVTGGTSLTYAGLTTANVTVGRPAWIEFDVAPGSSDPMTAISAYLQYTGSGAIHWRRYLTVQAAGWVRHRFLWVPREKTTTILLLFVRQPNATGTKVQIGRVRVYHAHEPVPERLALPNVTTTTTAPSAGAASALPATPQGYMTVNINGTPRQIAYY